MKRSIDVSRCGDSPDAAAGGRASSADGSAAVDTVDVSRFRRANFAVRVHAKEGGGSFEVRRVGDAVSQRVAAEAACPRSREIETTTPALPRNVG